MEYFPYFLVSGSEAWDDAYGIHSAYFNGDLAFFWSLLVAFGIGVGLSAIFYFVFCNQKSNALAKRLYYWIFFAVVAVATWFASATFIGHASSDNRDASGFYASIEKQINDFAEENIDRPDMVDDFQMEAMNIATTLDEYKDVEIPFNATNTVVAIAFYFGVGFFFRKYTRHGGHIPF